MPVFLEEGQDPHRFGQGFGLFVGPVGSGEGLEDVGDGHDAGRNGQVVLCQPARIARPRQRFVMGAGVLGNPLQLPGERQGVQHGDGLDDVLVDLEALLLAQRSPLHAQVENLSEVVEVFGNLHLESESGIEGLVFDPGNDVPGLVGEQGLDRRQFGDRNAFIPPQLLL